MSGLTAPAALESISPETFRRVGQIKPSDYHTE